MIVGKEVSSRSRLPKRVRRSIVSSLCILASFVVLMTYGAFGTTLQPATSAQAGSTLNVWWPTDGKHVQGLQPFKAMVEGQSVEQYEMFWQVDGGSLVSMNSNYTDYPHKEASVDVSSWNWRGAGPYSIHMVAKQNGSIISESTFNLYVDSKNVPTTASQTSTLSASASAPVAQAKLVTTQVPVQAAAVTLSQPKLTVSGNNPISGTPLYVNQNSNAAAQANSWSSSRSSDAQAMRLLANQPTASWFGNWTSNVYGDVSSLVSSAAAQGAAPVMVVYDIPGRDCSGGYSSGGSTSAEQYRSWISSMASAIGNKKAVVVLEPDALADLSCLSQGDQDSRLSLLSYAVSTLKAGSNTVVYLDAGHSGWIAPSAMAASLSKAGVSHADGFSVNVSNFDSTDASQSYGEQVSQLLGGAHYVIDTSRNGTGSNGQWCNPQGRAIGKTPTTSTGSPHIDAYLWLKTPGESDGNCNGGPNAGTWWADYALQLVRNAGQ